MKIITTFLFIITLTLTGVGQEKFILGKSDRVSFNPDGDYEAIDSLIYVNDDGRFCQCDSIEVYYDNEMNHLAYKSFQLGDSCSTYDYWRDGKIKKFVIYKKLSDGFPNWWYSELYCESGQLIFKGPSPNQTGKKHYINYYCNGQKMNEFDHIGLGADGKMIWWYENGQIMSVSFFEKNKESGKWEYWDENGKLTKIEIFENGKLIKQEEY